MATAGNAIGVSLLGRSGNSTDLALDQALQLDFNAVVPSVQSQLDVADKLQLMGAAEMGPLLSVQESVRRDLAKEGASWSQVYSIDEVMIHGSPFRLADTVLGTMTLDGGSLVLEVPELEIFVSGSDIGVVMREVNEEFEDLWDDFVKADESTLSARGLNLKRRLTALLGRK